VDDTLIIYDRRKIKPKQQKKKTKLLTGYTRYWDVIQP
jgi:hypothetical protein